MTLWTKEEHRIHWECARGKSLKCQEKAEELDERIRKIYEWQLDLEYVHNKLVDLEDRSRRNNLRIDGIKGKVGESWEGCEAEVDKLFTEKLDIEDKIIIETAHRAKKQKTAKKINQGQLSAVC